MVMAARRIFPGILHVDADFVVAFDLDSRDLEFEFRAWKPNHARRSGARTPCRRDLHQLLWQNLPLMRIGTERHARQVVALPEKLFQRCVGSPRSCEQRAESMWLYIEAQN